MAWLLQVGDVVEATENVDGVIDRKQRLVGFRSGSGCYRCAVIVQIGPLVLVSPKADMRWESTVYGMKLRAVATATPEQLEKCMTRRLS